MELKNSGSRWGAEAVQLYLGLPQSRIFRAARELAGFEKVYLEPGESKSLSFTLDARSFAYYNVPAAAWAVEGGVYSLEIGASSRDIRLRGTLQVAGDGREELLLPLRETAPAYFAVPRGRVTLPLDIPDADFAALYGAPLPPSRRTPGERFTLNDTLNDIKEHPAGKQFCDAVVEGLLKAPGGMGNAGAGEDIRRMFEAMFADMPLRALMLMSGGQVGQEQLSGLLGALNGDLG